MRLLIILLLLPCVTFGQLMQETNTSQAVRRLVAKNYLGLPKVCGTPGTPDGLNYSANDGAVVADTCNGNIKLYYNGSWITIASGGSGITSLNGLTGATQTFATGTSGTDFNINSTGTTHTFNIPSASSTNRGLVTTSAQNFAGIKTFDTTIYSYDGAGRIKWQMQNSGAGNTYGIGMGSVSPSFQFFAPSLNGFTFNGGGTLQTVGTNEWLRIMSSAVTIPSTSKLSTYLIEQPSAGRSLGTVSQFWWTDGASARYGVGIANASPFLQIFWPSAQTMSFNVGASGGLQTAGTGEVIRFNSTNVSIGNTAPSASAKLEVNSTTQGFLQPRVTSTQRNAISSPAAGLSVYNSTDGTNDVRVGSAWYNQPNGLKGSAALNFGNTAAQTSADLTITITGAADGDHVILGVPNGAVAANTCYTAWVSAANTVTVRFNNYSAGAVDPASATFKVYVIKN